MISCHGYKVGCEPTLEHVSVLHTQYGGTQKVLIRIKYGFYFATLSLRFVAFLWCFVGFYIVGKCQCSKAVELLGELFFGISFRQSADACYVISLFFSP